MRLATGWLQRDPAGYVDGPNLYGYADMPIGAMDPYGLSWREFIGLLDGTVLAEDDEHRAMIARTASMQIQRIREMVADGTMTECEGKQATNKIRQDQSNYNRDLDAIRKAEYDQTIDTLDQALSTAKGAYIPIPGSGAGKAMLSIGGKAAAAGGKAATRKLAAAAAGAAAKRLAKNKAAGLAAETAIAAEYRQLGYYVVQQMPIRTAFGRRIADLLVTDGEIIFLVEVKAGKSIYHAVQRAKDKYIETVYGVPTILRRVP